jgi:diaminohydroxyphosphoribosylaminopyrimidine deaminase / 5-amino-6-(5-phosphoribosylamino)uracil reductase
MSSLFFVFFCACPLELTYVMIADPREDDFHMASHHHFMQQAMALAEQARFHAPPNPWVGCIIVKEGQIIGQGYTQPPGQAHAEVRALQEAQEKAQGATLYATLEPCAHTGRTGPCTQAIIQAGIREVYFGIFDPDPRVKGKGASQLQQAGIKVVQGICEEDIQQSLAAYLHQRQTGLPYTLLKAAISLDGRIAATDHTSQWISCPQARKDAHLQRAASQAILVGAGTALHDSPQLTVRHSSYSLAQQPLRVLLDAKGRVPAKGPLFDPQLARTLVITTPQSSESRQKEWQAAGAEVVTVSPSSTGVNLQEAWQVLGTRSILQVLVEGGATLQTALLDAGLVNRLLIYIGPLLLGSSGIPFYHKHIATLEQAQRLSLQGVQKVGDCVRLDYQLKS